MAHGRAPKFKVEDDDDAQSYASRLTGNSDSWSLGSHVDKANAREALQAELEVRLDELELENISLRRKLRSQRPVKPDSLAQCETYARDQDRVTSWMNSTEKEHFIPSTSISQVPQQPPKSMLRGSFPIGLPNFKIKVFNGDPAEWPEWFLNFKNLVHENPGLTDGQKVGYLRTYLGTEPQSRIFGLLLDSKNYSQALNDLESRYGNPTFVVEAYINKVRQFPKIQKTSDIISLSTLVSQLVQIFQTMHYTADLEAKGLLVDLKSKLTQSLRESWGMFIVKHGGVPSVRLFNKWLLEKEEALRHGGTCSAVGEPMKPPRSTTVKQMTLFTPSSNESRDSKYCLFCTGAHWLTECRKFAGKPPPDRFQWFKSEGRCFLCHKKSHRSNDCVCKRRCNIADCGGRHSVLLHDVFAHKPERFQKSEFPSPPTASVSTTRQNMSVVYLQTLPVRVHSPNGRVVETFAMLDSGSQITLINQTFAKDIGLNGPSASLCIGNLRENEPVQKSKKVSFWLSDPKDPSMTPLKVQDAWTYNTVFNLPKQSSPHATRNDWPHVRDLDLPDNVDPSQITILIGVNTKKAFVQIETREGPEHLPMAVRTPLGWTLLGPAIEDTENSESAACATTVNFVGKCSVECVDDLHRKVERFWKSDSLGSENPSDKPFSVNDLKQQNHLDSTLRHTSSGHYEVGMLWSNSHIELPNNRPIAERRFQLLEKKLNKDPAMRERYSSVLNGYVSEGYARKMTPVEAAQTSDRTYYLPHHGVVNPKKPEKLRVVFDAAATYKGTSLNSQLDTGPDLLNSLVGVLARFRCGAVAISSDVQAMFHQCLVLPQDRDALRFLWKEDLSKPGPPDEYQMLVHVFGAKSSPTCANYCLQRCVVDNTDGEFSDEALYTVDRSFYVDDMCRAVDSVTQGIRLAVELVKLLGTGGFKLTKWASNNAEVLKAIGQLDPKLDISTVVDLDLDDKTKITQRTLGMHWNVKLDALVFEGIEMKCPLTKRGILSAISTVFDPLGFLAPFVLRAKLILQLLWEKGLDWDEPIDESELTEWQQWVTELLELRDVEISRCIWPTGFKSVRFVLHTFSDASERAYGAVCYLQMISDTGKLHVSFVMSKTRVAPVKRHCLTLPRLELQAAVLAVDLHAIVCKELDLPISESYFWCDSMIVLQYIHNDHKRHETFVANRVSKIRRNSEPQQWYFVPGILNPADDCSRGLAISELTNDSRWFQGASFLWLDKSSWPEQPGFSDVNETSGTEVANVGKCIATPIATVSEVSHKERDSPDDDGFIDPSNFSSLTRLKRVTSWCFRFIHNARNPNEKQVGNLTVNELNDAVMFWVKKAQSEAFQSEIVALSSDSPLPKRSPLLQLTPVLIDGVLRIGGRLHNAKLLFEARHQAIVPREHVIAKLLVVDAHKRLHHVGLEHTMAEIRQSYWVIRLRSMVKRVIYSCFYCRRRRVNPLAPLMASLPECRLSEQPCFTYTSLDYWGPMLIKRGRGREKRWGCLFTCLSTRAVHLEIVNGLGTDAFLMALRRFISRRGNPTEVFSDNGTNFVGANNELKKAIEEWDADERVQNMLSGRAIQWHFVCPRAPHMNGAAEALVGSTKRALKAILQEKCVHEDTLHTTVCEIEAILNSRPLTYNSSDPSDFEPLTPNHFLLSRPAKVFSPADVSDSDLSSRKRWRQCQVLADHFWRRWRREYLPTLALRSKWLCEVRNLKEGDVVQIADDNAPRGQWLLARVVEACPGKDGRVRVVKVKTSSGILSRPATKICFLEES